MSFETRPKGLKLGDWSRGEVDLGQGNGAWKTLTSGTMREGRLGGQVRGSLGRGTETRIRDHQYAEYRHKRTLFMHT